MFGETCRSYHSTTGQKICPHFLRGCCAFGDRCRNRHQLETSAIQTQPSPRAHSLTVNGVQPQSHAASTGSICSYYLQGKCRYGALCTNIHQPPVSMNATAVTASSQEPCKHFLKGKGRNGVKCPQSHGALPYSDRLSSSREVRQAYCTFCRHLTYADVD